MPIAQPPSITAHDRALPLFADRLAERRLFARYLHAAPPPERMLFFHGDGETLTRAPNYVGAHMNKSNALSKVSDLHLNLGDPVRAESAYLAAIAVTNEALSRAPNDVIASATRARSCANSPIWSVKGATSPPPSTGSERPRPCWSAP